MKKKLTFVLLSCMLMLAYVLVSCDKGSTDNKQETSQETGKPTIQESETSIGSEGLAYTVNEDGTSCTITGIGTCVDSHVIIPKFIDGYTVTTIGETVFYGCEHIREIIIPDTVTSIGNSAFYGCSSLTEISISNSVTSISDSAFYDCSSLTSITIPDSVTSIGYEAFHGCSSLTSITMPNNVTNIGYGAFFGCSSLTNITVPDSVSSIGENAFLGCSGLTSITIPVNVTYIGESVFGDCYRLAEVINLSNISLSTGGGIPALEIHNGVSKLIETEDGLIFYPCNDTYYLVGYKGTGAELVLPDGYQGANYQINKYAFYKCENLTSVTIPDSVTSIGEGAFWFCSGLTEISIPDSVTSIGDRAFDCCRSLSTVIIPNSVTIIGEYAFQRCDTLTDIHYTGTEKQWNNIDKNGWNTTYEGKVDFTIHYNYTPEE